MPVQYEIEPSVHTKQVLQQEHRFLNMRLPAPTSVVQHFAIQQGYYGRSMTLLHGLHPLAPGRFSE
jgi:hypothetical protein